MAHTRRTLKLNSDWDVSLDGSGGISLLDGAEATAQNVANECRLFRRDAWLCQDRGIPYFVAALGEKAANTSALRGYERKAALRVADVKKVESVSVSEFDRASRTLSGEIQVTTVGDEAVTVNF